jgi:hypothetical protein
LARAGHGLKFDVDYAFVNDLFEALDNAIKFGACGGIVVNDMLVDNDFEGAGQEQIAGIETREFSGQVLVPAEEFVFPLSQNGIYLFGIDTWREHENPTSC